MGNSQSCNGCLPSIATLARQPRGNAAQLPRLGLNGKPCTPADRDAKCVKSALGTRPEAVPLLQAADFVKGNQVIPTYSGHVSELYDLEETRRLGAGSYGSVFRGTHRASGAVRAVKVVRHRGSVSKKLQVEIATMKAMDHPHVIKLFEAFEDDKQTYLAMELCRGGELLDKIIQQKRFYEDQASIVMQQILKAVNYVHSRDIAHRDLKPQNFLLLTQDRLEMNTIKLIDFGFAAPCKPGTVLHTRAGTALYVAPQVLNGRYDKQCDLWSAGVTLYALLSGRAPFNGKCDREIFEKILIGRVDLEGKSWRRVSNGAKDLVLRLLRMNPRERLTADQALRHSWITRENQQVSSWRQVNNDAKDLVLSLLGINPRETFTADQALKHSRITGKSPAKQKVSLDSAVVQRLSCFRTRNKLERAVLKIIVRQLSEDKVKDLRQAFEALDVNNDGMLTMEELHFGLSQAGFVDATTTTLDLRCILASVDTDGSGCIDYSEFLAATLDRRLYLTEDTLRAAFQVFDCNDDGNISHQELKQILCTDDNNESNKRVDTLLSAVDLSGDGLIDFNEFKDMMVSWDSEMAMLP